MAGLGNEDDFGCSVFFYIVFLYVHTTLSTSFLFALNYSFSGSMIGWGAAPSSVLLLHKLFNTFLICSFNFPNRLLNSLSSSPKINNLSLNMFVAVFFFSGVIGCLVSVFFVEVLNPSTSGFFYIMFLSYSIQK